MKADLTARQPEPHSEPAQPQHAAGSTAVVAWSSYTVCALRIWGLAGGTSPAEAICKAQPHKHSSCPSDRTSPSKAVAGTNGDPVKLVLPSGLLGPNIGGVPEGLPLNPTPAGSN